MIQTTMVEFAGNGAAVPGYLAKPDAAGPFPAVVVIQEWWGLNAHIKDVVERFAREGFVALAPDLYRGAVASEPDDARKLAMELDRPQAIKDIQGAVDYLMSRSDVAPKNIGVMGFCMGGGLTAMMAYQGRHVGAAVIFYGNIRELATDVVASQVSAPLMGNFGEADSGIPVDTVQAAEQKLRALGKICDFKVYPDAPHAFFNNERASYREDAARDAWARTTGWLRQYLVE
jgi:carboxymethylenebutenolidase